MSTFWISNIHLCLVDCLVNCSLVAEQCPPLDCPVTTWVSAGSVSAALCCVAAWTRIEKQFVRIFSTLCTTTAHIEACSEYFLGDVSWSDVARGLGDSRNTGEVWILTVMKGSQPTILDQQPKASSKISKSNGVCFDSSSFDMGGTSPCKDNICNK